MAEHHWAIVRHKETNAKIAEVALNGYKKFTHAPVTHQAQQRLVWSFKILTGDRRQLQESWSQGQTLILQDETGDTATVRLALMPMSAKDYGLFEFL